MKPITIWKTSQVLKGFKIRIGIPPQLTVWVLIRWNRLWKLEWPIWISILVIIISLTVIYLESTWLYHYFTR